MTKRPKSWSSSTRPTSVRCCPRCLAGHGRRVEIVYRGRDALPRLEHVAFYLLASDLKMPEFGRRELYRLVVADRPVLCARILFVAGDTLRADVTDFMLEAGVVCLEMPVLPAVAVAAVAKVREGKVGEARSNAPLVCARRPRPRPRRWPPSGNSICGLLEPSAKVPRPCRGRAARRRRAGCCPNGRGNADRFHWR